MEKVPGVQLEVVWEAMRIEDRFQVVKTIAQYQKAWMSCSFQSFGSLYYSKDLNEHNKDLLYTDSNGTTTSDPRFAIGPSTGRSFIDDGRANVEFDRGPCESYN